MIFESLYAYALDLARLRVENQPGVIGSMPLERLYLSGARGAPGQSRMELVFFRLWLIASRALFNEIYVYVKAHEKPSLV